MSRNWYAIQSTEDGSAPEVHIYDEIGGYGVGAKEFIAELKQHSGNRIHLRINSVGGSVTEGLAIANAIKRHKGGVTAHVDGLAASMATVIAVSADETVMADNGIFMVHEPWSVGQGTADDLRAEADVLDKMKKSLVRSYTKKTGMDDEEVEELMRAETWMNAQEALAYGFIDYIEDGIEAAASITPEAARARFDTFQNSMARKTTKTIKAEEAAPAEVVAEPVVEAPVTDGAVDTSSEDNMNAELQAKVDLLQADLAAKVEAEAAQAQASEDIAKELETLKGEIDRLSSEVAARDEEINALRAASKSAGEQAAAIVASVGLEPVVVQPAEQELSAAQVFNSLTGADAVEYFRNNKRQIMASVY
jgi:ATP-dependent Clp endopeptidase proteolytic subunit ClpP